jgi:hypothetical protein
MNIEPIRLFVYFLPSVVLSLEAGLLGPCKGSGVCFYLYYYIQIDLGPHLASNSVSVPELGFFFSLEQKLPIF